MRAENTVDAASAINTELDEVSEHDPDSDATLNNTGNDL